MEPLGLVVHGKAEPFSEALRSLVNNPRYSDVCFVVGQERQEVFAHRCLLACRCNFFQRLLGTEPGPGVPSPVVLSTVPTEAFLAVLEFLYTNSVKLHRHSVLEVLTAAVEYGLEELREVAVTFGLGPLQERCVAFIEAHSQEALRSQGFLELSAAALLPLLRSDKLCVDEAELVRAARSWARVGAAVLERPVAEVAAPVVKELRLALLAPAELSALEEQNRQEPLIPVRTRGTGPAPLSRGRSRLWRRGNAMPCGEGMRPGAPRVAAGEAPCPGSITAFWTYPLNDPTPGLTGSLGPAQLSLPQTTAPEVLGVRSGLPFPACPVSRAPEEPLSATRSLLCGVKPEWARWVGAGSGRAWAGPPCVGETRKRGFPSLHALTLRPAPGGIVVY
ncbi:BTB/POZ domain-containing protein 19 isoform X2 [Chlorocebus sabaeus]|uniref:BTB/POZ domain-containing protein 19 isoform X2 n=1 Tax=Chlorocebus sabaeus TaxID=60711 RepID=UPI00045E48F5|nr:BTB/POZ domain-containing protein 19 isoform X3 [Chlorocebus sabaeus]